MGINYTPTFGTYNKLGSFEFWCQKILPLVYDDSLSYYEVLCKIASFLNNVIQNSDTLNDDINSLLDAYNKLQDYINNYFDNLDVQNEINNKIDSMIDNGSYYELIQNAMPLANVKNYGAVGDGETDDHDAFVSALADENYSGIYIPNGVYYIGSAITITRDHTFVIGRGGIITTSTPSGDAWVTHTSYSIFNVRASYVTFDGVNFTDYYVQTYVTNSCIFRGTLEGDGTVNAYLRVKNCNFYTCCRRAVNLYSYATSNETTGAHTIVSLLRFVTVENCFFRSCRSCVVQSSVNYVKIINNLFFDTAYNEYVTVDNKTSYCQILNNTFYGACGGTGGIGIDEANDVIISGNEFRMNNDNLPAIAFNRHTGLSQYITISNNTFLGNTSSSIPFILFNIADNTYPYFNGASRTTVTGNIFYNRTAYRLDYAYLAKFSGNIYSHGTCENNLAYTLIPYVDPDFILFFDVTDTLLSDDWKNDSEQTPMAHIILNGSTIMYDIRAISYSTPEVNDKILNSIGDVLYTQCLSTCFSSYSGGTYPTRLLFNTDGSISITYPLPEAACTIRDTYTVQRDEIV